MSEMFVRVDDGSIPGFCKWLTPRGKGRGGWYAITYTDTNSRWMCNCLGNYFRGTCSHVDELKRELKIKG